MSDNPVLELGAKCVGCGKLNGVHTLFEFQKCTGVNIAAATLDPSAQLPFEPIPDDAQAFITKAFIDKLPGYDVVDHVVIKAAGIGIAPGGVPQTCPALLFEFALGIKGRAPAQRTKVAYLGTRQGIADLVGLVTDSAKAAIQNSTI